MRVMTRLGSTEATQEITRRLTHRASVYIYEPAVRIWHWLNALFIFVLIGSGYFLNAMLPAVAGNDTNTIPLFGFVRLIHITAGYGLAVGFLFRIYWAMVGNIYARQLFVFPFWRLQFWNDIWVGISWYLFLRKDPKMYLGHNPLAHFVTFFMITCLTTFMIATGMALYGLNAGPNSWQMAAFGWVLTLFPNAQDLHTWHRLGMWAFILYTTVHVYAAVREDIMSRQSMVSTMISGRRLFKDDLPW